LQRRPWHDRRLASAVDAGLTLRTRRQDAAVGFRFCGSDAQIIERKAQRPNVVLRDRCYRVAFHARFAILVPDGPSGHRRSVGRGLHLERRWQQQRARADVAFFLEQRAPSLRDLDPDVIQILRQRHVARKDDIEPACAGRRRVVVRTGR
jgi:hypothetical protein